MQPTAHAPQMYCFLPVLGVLSLFKVLGTLLLLPYCCEEPHWMENKESHWLIRIKLLKRIKIVFVFYVSVV